MTIYFQLDMGIFQCHFCFCWMYTIFYGHFDGVAVLQSISSDLPKTECSQNHIYRYYYTHKSKVLIRSSLIRYSFCCVYVYAFNKTTLHIYIRTFIYLLIFTCTDTHHIYVKEGTLFCTFFPEKKKPLPKIDPGKRRSMV